MLSTNSTCKSLFTVYASSSDLIWWHYGILGKWKIFKKTFFTEISTEWKYVHLSITGLPNHTNFKPTLKTKKSIANIKKKKKIENRLMPYWITVDMISVSSENWENIFSGIGVLILESGKRQYDFSVMDIFLILYH